MEDKDYIEIRDLYKRFEGLTGSQEADVLLLLAVILKQGLKEIDKTLTGIEESLDEISGQMP